MDTKKSAAPEAASEDAKRGPVKTFSSGDVSASVFIRDFNGRTFHSVTVNRWYRDKKGQSQYTSSFDADDLGDVVAVSQQANEYIRDAVEPSES